MLCHVLLDCNSTGSVVNGCTGVAPALRHKPQTTPLLVLLAVPSDMPPCPAPASRYFAILLDRKIAGPLMIGCSEGGTSIEDLAEKFPDKIIKVPVDVRTGELWVGLGRKMPAVVGKV